MHEKVAWALAQSPPAIHPSSADRAGSAGELPPLPIEFHPAARALADAATDCKARHKISLADAFTAALAKERQAELITGAPEFKALDTEIKMLG